MNFIFLCIIICIFEFILFSIYYNLYLYYVSLVVFIICISEFILFSIYYNLYLYYVSLVVSF